MLKLNTLYLDISTYFSYFWLVQYTYCREQFDTWHILARARNENRLFTRIEWPKDSEIVCFCFELCSLMLPLLLIINDIFLHENLFDRKSR